MGSLGETLRQARLDRGVSLSDAEGETHIRRKYLEALEAEDFATLPAMVYTRGFIRTYARYLGLDPELTLDLMSTPRSRDERAAIRPATAQLTSVRPASVRIFTAVAGLVLVALLLAYLWTQYTSFVESLGPSDAATIRSTATPPRPAATSPVQPTPDSAPAPAAVAPAVSPTPDRGIALELRVTERTWIEVWVDGSPELQTTLQAGITRGFNANQSIRLRIGNAAGVQVTVNGQPQPPLGDRFQVKEFVYER